MHKLRAELSDPELQGWVVFPRACSVSAPPVDYMTLLRSRPLPQLLPGPSASSLPPSSSSRHDALASSLSAALPQLLPRPTRPPPASTTGAVPPAGPPASLGVLRAAFETGAGLL